MFWCYSQAAIWIRRVTCFHGQGGRQGIGRENTHPPSSRQGDPNHLRNRLQGQKCWDMHLIKTPVHPLVATDYMLVWSFRVPSCPTNIDWFTTSTSDDFLYFTLFYQWGTGHFVLLLVTSTQPWETNVHSPKVSRGRCQHTYTLLAWKTGYHKLPQQMLN